MTAEPERDLVVARLEKAVETSDWCELKPEEAQVLLANLQKGREFQEAYDKAKHQVEWAYLTMAEWHKRADAAQERLQALRKDYDDEGEAAQEREKALQEIVAKHEKVCSDCDGAGYLQDGECDWCGASGFVCDDLALAWADVRSLAAQRTEEPSDA